MGVPRNWAFPATQGPKTGGPAKELSQTQAPTQACEAAAQVRSGAVHAWRRTAQPQLRAAYSTDAQDHDGPRPLSGGLGLGPRTFHASVVFAAHNTAEYPSKTRYRNQLVAGERQVAA